MPDPENEKAYKESQKRSKRFFSPGDETPEDKNRFRLPGLTIFRAVDTDHTYASANLGLAYHCYFPVLPGNLHVVLPQLFAISIADLL